MPTSLEIRCPAGVLLTETVEGPACRCRITHDTIGIAKNPHSIAAFCAGKYVECPVWRREKKAIAERRLKELEREIEPSAVEDRLR